MPKNKKPNRKPGIKKNLTKRKGPDNSNSEHADDNVKGARSAQKNFGGPKSSGTSMSPAMNRGAARGG